MSISDPEDRLFRAWKKDIEGQGGSGWWTALFEDEELDGLTVDSPQALKQLTKRWERDHGDDRLSDAHHQGRFLVLRDMMYWGLLNEKAPWAKPEIVELHCKPVPERAKLDAQQIITPHAMEWLYDRTDGFFEETLLGLLAAAALRTGEVGRLSPDQFHRDERADKVYLDIEGARNCDRRRLTLSQERLRGLEDYCNRHGRSLTDSSAEPIFLGPTGDPIAERTLRDRLNRLGEDLGFGRSLSTRRIRNSWAFWQFLAGQSLVTIKRFLGIGKIETLERRLAPFARIRDGAGGPVGASPSLPFFPSE